MSNVASTDIAHRIDHPTGETCPGCGCEVLLVVTPGDAALSSECDCGTVSALADDLALLPAA